MRGGGTSSAWNKRMLNDTHLKIIKYFPKSSDVFSNVDIKGGIVITYHDAESTYKSVKTFYAFDELRSIARKVESATGGTFSLNTIIANRGLYRFSEKAYRENPCLSERLSDSRIAPGAFVKVPEIFYDDVPDDGHAYVELYGKVGRDRVYKWIRRDYVKHVDNIDKYKVIMPKANGSGAIGEVLSTPLIGKPLIGYTETFVSIGNFSTRKEAAACLKYIKTKFARALLGILKVTQSNTRETWKHVPLQDFTDSSDIDWSQSVENIDEQLFDKYGLDEKEREFIKTHVAAMK